MSAHACNSSSAAIARTTGFSREPPAAAKPAYANSGRKRLPLSNKKAVNASDTGDSSVEIEFR